MLKALVFQLLESTALSKPLVSNINLHRTPTPRRGAFAGKRRQAILVMVAFAAVLIGVGALRAWPAAAQLFGEDDEDDDDSNEPVEVEGGARSRPQHESTPVSNFVREKDTGPNSAFNLNPGWFL